MRHEEELLMVLDSPYRGEINKVVLKLQEEGKLNELKKKWWKEMHGGGACDVIQTNIIMVYLFLISEFNFSLVAGKR